MRADIFEPTINGITYQCEGPKLNDGLKVTVTVLNADGTPGHSDRLNLDRATARERFAESAGVDASDLLALRNALMEWLAGPAHDDNPDGDAPEETAIEAAHELLNAPDLLERAGETIRTLGYAGDLKLVKLLFLVLVSRLLARPLNVVITGPSSAGKSFLVNLVTRLFPTSATYSLTSMSERALAYTDADLQHKHIIVGESAGLHKNGIGMAIIRGITWEGNVVYETVERTEDGMKPRRIEKPGPTGFVTTVTKRVNDELETRVLTVTVPDTEDVTRTIIRATAARANGRVPESPDLSVWHALQHILSSDGDTDVAIPYSEQLAELYPSNLVRGRRDFTQLLTLIQASALLHQHQRDRDEHGRIVANRQDYELVHELTADLFGSIVAEGVTPAIRETVAAVAELTEDKEHVSISHVARYLGLERSATSYRVKRAITGGFLANAEEGDGKPAKLCLGAPLPDETPALADPKTLFTDTPDFTGSQVADSAHADAENTSESPDFTGTSRVHTSSPTRETREQPVKLAISRVAAHADAESAEPVKPVNTGSKQQTCAVEGCTSPLANDEARAAGLCLFHLHKREEVPF